MRQSMKRIVAKVMAGTLVLSLCCPLLAVSADAKVKAPSLSAKKATITVKKTKKITIKNAKKAKKTTWNVKNKKVVKLSKKAKTSVTMQGLKTGSTTVTAKVKLGKKTYKLNCKVTVKKAVTPTKIPATSTPVPTPTATPVPQETVPPTTTPKQTIIPVKLETMEPSIPTATSVPDGKLTGAYDLSSTFDSYTVGDSVGFKSYDAETNTDIITKEGTFAGDTLDGWTYRRTGVDNSTTLKAVIDADGADGKCLRITGRKSTAQGALLVLTDIAEPGGTYEFTAKVKKGFNDKGQMEKGALVCSTQTKATALGKETYANVTSFSSNLDKWQEIKATFQIPDDMESFGFYIETYDDPSSDIYIDDVSFSQIRSNKEVTNLESLKDIYSGYFKYLGCGLGYDSFMGDNALKFIKEQYNSVTFGNEMKPDAIMPSKTVTRAQTQNESDITFITADEAKAAGYIIPDSYLASDDNKIKDSANPNGALVVPKLNFTQIDQLLKRAKENGIKIRGHVLLWHQQTPTWFFQKNFSVANQTKQNVSADVMNSRIEFYIRSVMDHVLKSEYADVIYSWDVVNEYFHSGNAHTNDGTYYDTIYGTDDTTFSTQSGRILYPSYVKLALQIANDELFNNNRTDITLIYNDYNEYDVSNDIIEMLWWINEKDNVNTYGTICDGVGMQAHLDMMDKGNYPTIHKFAETLESFRVNLPGLEITVTELDVTLGLNDAATKVTELDHASYYEDIMRSILACKQRGAKIDSVTIWSLYDGVSWRSSKLPCVFKGLNAPKASFYSIIDAVKTYFPTPFITN